MAVRVEPGKIEEKSALLSTSVDSTIAYLSSRLPHTLVSSGHFGPKIQRVLSCPRPRDSFNQPVA